MCLSLTERLNNAADGSTFGLALSGDRCRLPAQPIGSPAVHRERRSRNLARDHGHKDGQQRGWRLLVALGLNVSIAVAQIVGGLISGSLSVMADAAHNASDAATLGISYFAWRLSRRKADERRTFGYRRAETIGALINFTTLFVIALYLLYEAASRLFNPQEVGGWVMIIVGGIAAVEDALSVWVLSKNRGSLNMKSAFLHMIADTMATIGVIIGGVLILLFNITWVDPLITAAIAVYIFVHGYREMGKTISVLMESAPEGFDIAGMVRRMEDFGGVESVHHVHVWRPDEERIAVEAHVAVEVKDMEEADAIRRGMKDRLREEFEIEHAMLEFEFAGNADHSCEMIRQE
jgi:cobalt-zinc-cadmium efflux system protein